MMEVVRMHRTGTLSVWSKLWFVGLIAVSVAILAATVIYQELDIAQLTHLTLTQENNVGAWWSGILLLIGAVHAFDGYRLWKRERRRVAMGWAALSLALLILSLDEIGSLHERVELLLPGGVWLNVLPFALVVLGLFVYAAVSLWRSRDYRQAAVLVVLAFLCFGATAFQDYLEHNDAWMSMVPRGLRAGLEEGSELVGMLLLIRAALPNTGGSFRRGAAPRAAVLEAPFSWRRYVIPVALALSPVLAYVSARWLLDHRGHPANWLASALYFLAAVAVLRPLVRIGTKGSLWHWVLAGSAVLASVSSTALNNMLPYVLAGLSLVIAGAWLLVPSALPMGQRLAAGGALLGVAVVLVALQTGFMLEMMPILGSVLVYAVTTALIRPSVPERLRSEARELAAEESRAR